MSLIKRKLRITFNLGLGDFGETGHNAVVIENVRASVNVSKGGLPSLDTAVVQVYGLSKSLLNQLSRLGKPLDEPRNNGIIIEAGNENGSYSHVFTGVIVSSYADTAGLPEVSLNVSASAGLIDLARPVDPISMRGTVSVADVASLIAASMNKAFLNSGVIGTLNGVYLPGTAMDQLRALKTMAGINADPNGGPTGETLVIWPTSGVLGGNVPYFDPTSGLVGFPRYADQGIEITVLYRSGIVFGGTFGLDSVLEPANGLWQVVGLSYELESEVDGGAWFATIVGTRPPDEY